jgi:hypothetical protein
VIFIIVDFTEAEISEINGIQDRYAAVRAELEKITSSRTDMDETLFGEGNARLQKLRDALPPEPIPREIWDEYKAKEQAITAEQDRKYNLWYQSGSAEWQAAMKREREVDKEYQVAIDKAVKKAEKRQFDELGGDPEAILLDAASQAEKYINNRYAYYKTLASQKEVKILASEFVQDGASFKLDGGEMRKAIVSGLYLHIAAVEGDAEHTERLFSSIDEALLHSPYVEQETRPSKRSKAIQSGAVLDIGERALAITDRNYQFALSTKYNDTAYLVKMDKQFIESMEFEGGSLSISNSTAATAKIRRGNSLQEIESLDIQLLRSLFTAIYYNATKATEDTVTVYVPTLCKHLGVNITSGKAYPLFDKINSFSDVVGVFSDGSIFSLLKFIKYDKSNNTMTFASPYMNKIIYDISKKNNKVLKNGSKKKMPAYSYLIHSSIASERNKVAVEIVQVIVALVQQRGIDTRKSSNCKVDPADGKVITEAHIRFSTILEYIPTLQGRIEQSQTVSAKNAQLRRAFTKAYDLLKTKTDIYQNYIDLNVPEIVPTAKTLEQSIVISHKGFNPQYRSRK